ncbi:MAG: hypothetical protein UMV23_05340 [Halanaerobium sp.]|nr:hypothetical protein [Halanaerobium sp.]
MQFRFGELEPMYLTLVDRPFSSPDYYYELKWDGVRALGFFDNEMKFRIQSRNGNDLSRAFPEIIEEGNQLGARVGREFILDGELCVLDGAGKPDFELVMSRVLTRKEVSIRDYALRRPASLIVWDLLQLGDIDMTGNNLTVRREGLEEVLAGFAAEGRYLFISPLYPEGNDLFQAVKQQGLEGIVAKRKVSPYLPGQRTMLWQKIKNFKQGIVLVGGYLTEREGSYIVGAYEEDRLVYLGCVGGGLTLAEARALDNILSEIEQPTCPFSPVIKLAGAIWVEPLIAIEVSFLSLTAKNSLRHAVIEGIPFDIQPRDCTLDKLLAGEK